MDGELTQRLSALTQIGSVLARVEALAQPTGAREAPTADAEGRVLAADAGVEAPHPPAALALRDGWAVRADAVGDAGPYSPAPIAAPQWIDAGMPMPIATDAVLPRDAVMRVGAGAEALAAAVPGDGVLAAGADAAPGAPLRRAGRRLRAADVAALQQAGVARVSIREPRVRVVAMPGCDAVALTISRGVAAHGANVIFVRALERALADEQTDLVITVGGTGEGRNDTSVATLARMGKLDIHGFGMTPGETAALGSAKGHPVLMLPGRLDAALAVWLTVGHRLLARLAGGNDADSTTALTLVRKVASSVGLAEFVPVRRNGDTAEPLATKYLPLSALTRADGWILVPAGSEGYPEGATVMMRPWP